MARQTLDVDLGVVDDRHDGVDDLAEVVRSDVRRHSDGDAGGAVDEQVREPRRENRGLAARLVVVGLEVDRVRVDVAQQLGRNAREARLGVAHRRRGIVVDVPEVALPLDERVAHRERLRQADERVVDRGVAVRVVGAHDVADDARGLLERPVRLHAGLVHPVEDAPVHGLQPVAHIRQGARDDHAHRVVEEARPELLLQVPRLDAAGAERFEESDIEEANVPCVLLDEEPARLDLVAHQHRESQVRRGRVLHLDADQHPVGRVHRRLPEILGVHLAEALEAPDLDPVLGEVESLRAQALEGVGLAPLAAERDPERWRPDQLHEPRVRPGETRIVR